MQGVIERRRAYLHLMRRFTLEKGSFTVQDILQEAGVPRSTVQDWIARLTLEGCVVLREPPRGRVPAQYAAASAMPRTACRRIFTSVDGDLVEIVHECLSSACAGFCGHHHAQGCGGEGIAVIRDGTLLREYFRLGERDIRVGLYPDPAVAVTGVYHEGDEIIQRIRSVGGPSFSLTGMMSLARGVLGVEVIRDGECTEGRIRTRALTHLTIGIDNTDTRDDGATFALAIALLEHLGALPGVFPIAHQVAMLCQSVPGKTAGNSCSAIEIAAEPGIIPEITAETVRFIADESSSDEWGIALRCGLWIPAALRWYGWKARSDIVTLSEAVGCASGAGVLLAGREGRIGALAAVALSGIDASFLLDPYKNGISLISDPRIRYPV
ncbi:MAG TPA: sugar-specific transcriptional regulator TrmB [Methanospirillum sp.]|nr:sugar-specific transcriptional regulator TrmB [Methanospirillum sp.]